MHGLMSILIPLIVTIGIALIIWVIVERFSPDAVITRVAQIVIFIVVLVVLLGKLSPLLGLS